MVSMQELHPKQLKAEKYTKLEPTLVWPDALRIARLFPHPAGAPGTRHDKQLFKYLKWLFLNAAQATDLVIHGNGRYQMPIEKNLAHVSEDDFVKVAFIHKADVW